MRLTLGVLILARVFAQSSLDPAALLARQEQELNRHRSYEFTEETSTTVKTPRMDMPPMNSTTVTQAVNPGKLRTEVTSSGLPGGITLTTVSDGTQTWTYMPLLNRYTHTQGGEAANGKGGAATPDMDGITAAAKVTGSEFLEIDGEQHDCWVLESSVKELEAPPQNTHMQDAVYKAWIDKVLGIQWKTTFSANVQAAAALPSMETSVTTTIHSLKFDIDLPDSLFAFTPPSGAKETAELVPGMRAMLDGGASKTDRQAPRSPAASKPETGTPEAFIPDLRPIHKVEAVRPVEAGDLQGMVRVLATIDATGGVTGVEVLAGREIFRSAATDAVKQWSFHPVLRDGHAVAAYTEEMVDFLLEKEPAADDFATDISGELQAQQRIEELTEKFPRSPEQVLADTEEQQRGVTGLERFFALPKLSRQAFAAGDLVKAKDYATELLEKAKDFKDVDGTGTAAFDADTVLGRIALREGSVSQAREYLLESAKAAPSDFEPLAPDFTLARELLAKGDRDAVVEFLTACKGFWKSGAENLDKMIASVRSGQSF